MARVAPAGWLVLSALGIAGCSSDDDGLFRSATGGAGGADGSAGGAAGAAGASGVGGTGTGATSGAAGGSGTAGAGGGSGAAGSGGGGGAGAAGAGGGGSGGASGSGGSGGGVSPCGNGQLEPWNGEECDDGGNAPGDGCDGTCQLEPVGASCGDGAVQAGETCDDSNTTNGDACNPTCNFSNTTTVFAGTQGNPGYQDAVGVAARLGGYGDLFADQTHLWLADGANRRIRRIDVATATVTTVAGDGSQGWVDAPVGVNARFGAMEAIVSDGVTVWVADGGNHRLRAVSTTPPYAVTTVAGSGAQAVTDGVGAAAAFDGVRGLAYHAGVVYILDGNTAVLRSFDPATGQVTTLAGAANQFGNVDGIGTAARFVSPRYLTSDNQGTLYVSDTNGFALRSFTIATAAVGTLAGNGTTGYVDATGTAARVHRPRGITSDGTSVYFCEFNQHTIRQVSLPGGAVTTMLGQHCGGAATCNGGYAEGVGTAALLDGPFAITYHFPSRSLFFLDGGNAVIRRVR